MGFRINVEQSDPHGGPFAHEVRTTWKVVHVESGRVWRTFTGTDHRSLEGGDWGEAAPSGVRSVRLDRDGLHVLVDSGRGEQRYELPRY